MDQESDQKNFMQKHKFTLISLFIILLAAIPLLLLSNTASKKSVPATQTSPTPAPLTTSNVEPTMTQVDSDMQQSLTQIDADLKAAAAINTTQDSTSGL